MKTANLDSIYLDYMATTPVDPIVVQHMLKYLGPYSHFGNASSRTHSYGIAAATAVEQSREQVAQLINASPEEIVFTSGATEANNLALFGAAQFYQNKGKHLITMSTEHKAVLDVFLQLEKKGFEVSYLDPQVNGSLDLNILKDALRSDTILVSIMHVNNEIGIIQDIQAIGNLLHDKGIVFHVDAAQSAGKTVIDLNLMPVDLMSLSAHKNYGPKGIGALYVRRKPRVRLQAQLFGGSQEQGLRPGTLATHQIAGMGEAFVLSHAVFTEENKRILNQRQRLWEGIRHVPGIFLNGDAQKRVAGNLNIGFKGLDGNSLLLALHELAISTTSACMSASIQPSYVLKALGLSEDLILSSLRISIGRFTTEEEIDYAIQLICTRVSALRDVSPI